MHSMTCYFAGTQVKLIADTSLLSRGAGVVNEDDAWQESTQKNSNNGKIQQEFHMPRPI